MRKTNMLSGEISSEKIKLDKQSFDKIVMMALESVNGEKLFKFDDWRLGVTLVDDKFKVTLSLVLESTLDDDGMMLTEYIIDRGGNVEVVKSLQSFEEFTGEEYNQAVEVVDYILENIE